MRKTEERWKTIPSTVMEEGYYEASTLGKIRRIGTPVHPSTSPNGYSQVSVRVIGKPYRMALLHRLVAEAFLGPIPPGVRVRHKNRDKKDNRPENLQYVLPNHDVIAFSDESGIEMEPESNKFKTAPAHADVSLRMWMAGMVDGEGSISVVKCKKSAHRKSNTYVLEVQVANTELELVEPFLHNFGGHISSDTHERWRTCFKWNAAARKAAVFLEFVRPYLHSLRKQEFAMRELNRRGRAGQ